MHTRRQVLLGTASAVVASSIASLGWANASWPSRPISITIGNAPGGDADVITRFIGQSIGNELGQPIVVQNKPGGSTTVAAATVAAARPDGHELLCLFVPAVLQSILRKDLSFTIEEFVPIVGIGGYPLALITSTKAGLSTLDEFYAKAKSGEGVNYATAGVGTNAHLTMSMMLSRIGGKGVNISFKSNPEGVQTLMGGFVEAMFISAAEATTLQADPNVSVLAVTSAERLSSLPDVPTTAELGYPDVDIRGWYGYVAPKGTPEEVVTKLSQAVIEVVEGQAFQDRFGTLSFQTNITVGEEFGKFIAEEKAKFAKIIQENNITI